MKVSRLQFTMRQMMVAVLIAAGLLGVLRTEIGQAISVLSLPGIGGCAVAWVMTRHRLGWAAFGFSALISFEAVLGGLGCIYVFGIGEMVLLAAMLIWITPILLGFAAAWANASSRSGAKNRWHPFLAWPLVLLLTALGPTIVYFHWPIRLAFHASRPALNQLADQVQAGQGVRLPQWAGLFWIVGSRVEPRNGNIALLTDDSPGGPSGLVRLGPNNPEDSMGPIVNHNVDEPLDERWRFQEED